MKTLQFLFVMLIFCIKIHGQQQSMVYDRIPLYVFPWALSTANTQSQIQSIKDMGGDGVIAQEVRAVLFDSLHAANLKIIPYNAVLEYPYLNYISKYTDASYTVWEAEGTDISIGEVTLKPNDTISEEIIDGGVTWVRTISGIGSNTLLSGPGYYQSPYYIIEPGGSTSKIRKYNAKYILKIDTNPQLSMDSIAQLESENDTVCILHVTYNPRPMNQQPITIDSLVLRISDLKPYNSIKSKIISYDLEGIQHSIMKTMSAVKENLETTLGARYVEFRVEWKGLSYVRLWVDKVIASDDRGRYLIDEKRYDDDISWQANNSLLAYPSDKYDSTIVGWYAVDEPSNIDNCEPLRYIDSLIKSATNGKKHLVVSLAGNFSGWFESDSAAPSESVYRINELIKRSKTKSVMLNFYPYNWPWRDTANSNYQSANLFHLTECHLNEINKLDTLFWSSIQTGKWQYEDINGYLAGADKIPTISQYLYQINLSLLYGSKGIILNNYFYGNNALITSLYNYLNDEKHYLWYTTRDTVSPRLKGLMGKTLRNISQTLQKYVDITNESEIINEENLYYITKNSPIEGNTFIDIGFFTGINMEKYVMLLNRYYSESTDLRICLRGLNGYRNWRLKEYRDTTDRFITAITDTSSFVDTIGIGDAKLYSVRPCVQVGGQINYSETISSASLTENELYINSGNTLTVTGTYNCYKNIVVNTGGKLSLKPGSALNFYNGAKLVVNGAVSAIGNANSQVSINFHGADGNTMNCIELNPGSIDTIHYCEIKNGYYGIKADSVNAYIACNDIHSCNTGIYVTDSDYQIETNEGILIEANNVHNNADNGIDIIDSSPLILRNIVEYNTYGIQIIGTSAPYFGNLYDYGLNKITENEVGIYSYNSSPMLGSEGADFYGMNSIVKMPVSAYDVQAYAWSYIMAENCWWGEYLPNTSHFYLNRSSLDYSPALDYDPFYTGNKNETGEELLVEGKVEVSVKEKYKTALKKYYSGEKEIAKGLLKQIIDESPDSAVSYAALRFLIINQKTESEKDSLTGLLRKLIIKHSEKEIGVYSKIELADLIGTNYINEINTILTAHPETEFRVYLLFKKIAYYVNETKEREKAEEIYQQMKTEFPNERLTKEALSMLGKTISVHKGKGSETEEKQLSYKLENNYPNPFNPETVISYSIPKSGKVKLTVYNILGREIATLVNGDKEKGEYKVTFNASKLASGVYIYRIIAGDFVMTKKMNLVK